MQVSAIVHLTDPEVIKQVIAAEAEGSAATEYKGITYWRVLPKVAATLLYWRIPSSSHNSLKSAKR